MATLTAPSGLMAEPVETNDRVAGFSVPVRQKVINGEPGASATGVQKSLLGQVLQSLTLRARRSEADTLRSPAV